MSEKCIAYCVSRQAWENPNSGCDTVLCAMEDGTLREECHHPEMWWWQSPWFKNAELMAPDRFREKYQARAALTAAPEKKK